MTSLFGTSVSTVLASCVSSLFMSSVCTCTAFKVLMQHTLASSSVCFCLSCTCNAHNIRNCSVIKDIWLYASSVLDAGCVHMACPDLQHSLW